MRIQECHRTGSYPDNPVLQGEDTAPSQDASIQVDDEYVSRKHATLHIEERDGKMYFSVEDLKSTNGTFDKNKKKLKPGLKYPFLPDDYFIIGLTKISIKL
jgi:hypothetical protein